MPAADPTKIHLAPGDVWVTPDLTAAPTKGVDLLDPTSSSLMTFTTGFGAPNTTANPAWRYVGFTNGPAVLQFRPTYYMVETEQAFAEVLVVPTAEEATFSMTMQEADYRNLALSMGQGTTEVNVSAPANNAIFVGGKASVNLNVVTFLSRHRTGVGYFVGTLYQSYSNDGAALNWERRAEQRNAVTMRCLADTSRPVGDQLFQLADYAANPS
jgi:hypothetical protein